MAAPKPLERMIYYTMPKNQKSSSGTKTSNCGTNDKRARNFACVVYPESAPENWVSIAQETKIPILISPLHDKDVNPVGNEPKKPHYHVIAAFEGKKSIEQATELFSSFGGVGCEVIASLRGYARYLCHLDNPEKAQYNVEDVQAFGGIDYISCIGLPTDKYKIVGEMIDWCVENNVYSYADLLCYARAVHYDWFRVLCDSSTMVMKEFLKARYWEKTEGLKNGLKVDADGVMY